MNRHFVEERQLQSSFEDCLAHADFSVDVLDVELDSPRQTVRVYISSPASVDLELCTRVTKTLRDLVPDFALEVSSPGDKPPLRHARHFAEHVGAEVRVRRHSDHKAFLARIDAVADNVVQLQRDDGTVEAVPTDELVRSHLTGSTVIEHESARRSR